MNKDQARAPVAPPPPENEDSFSDFGFSSTGSSSDELGSKIDNLVAMVKSKVKKKKKKRRKHSEQGSAAEENPVASSEPIPKLKITFGKQKSGSEDLSSGEDTAKKNSNSPMKLTIKLGAVGSSPLLPPPPLLTLHKPDNSTQPSSPKYEPTAVHEAKNIIKLKRSDIDNTEEKPPIKLTLRMAQPMRNAKGWISPRTEQLVNYIDNVTTFVDEGVELDTSPGDNSPGSGTSGMSDSVADNSAGSAFPEPPKLKLAPTSPSKRSARISASSLSAKPVPSSTLSVAGPSNSSVLERITRMATKSLVDPSPLNPVLAESASVASKSSPIKSKSTSITTKIKILAPATCRKRKRESSPKHSSVPSPKDIIEESYKPLVPPLKFPKSCLADKTEPVDSIVKRESDSNEDLPKRKSRILSASSSDAQTTKGPKIKDRKEADDKELSKEYWKCGIFSNSLKQKKNAQSTSDELDFRSNILPIYCGK